MPYANQLGNKYNKRQEKVDIHDKRITEFTNEDVDKILKVSDTLEIEATDLVIPEPSENLPLMNGTASAGSEDTWSRSDHVHPSDTSKAPLNSPAFTGNPTAPTPVSDTSISNKGYVDAQVQTIFAGAAKILKNTTANWNAQLTLISDANTIYLYTDHETVEEGGQTKYIPGVKFGDGLAYLIDLPFVDAVIVNHMNNDTIHVTQEEKNFWNNKNRAFISNEDEENLILTTL